MHLSARHHRLVSSILSGDETVVVIAGLPGTGKTALLNELARRTRGSVLRSLPAAAPPSRLLLVDQHEDGPFPAPPPGARLVVATDPATLATAPELRMRNDVRLIADADLFLAPDEDPVFEQSGGWPILAAHFSRPGAAPEDAVDFLRDVVARRLSSAGRDAVLALCATRGGLLDPPLPPAARAVLRELGPLVHRQDGRWQLRPAGLAGLLRQATAGLRAGTGAVRLLDAGGEPERAIAAAIGGGHRALAREVLERHGGMFLTHTRGPDAARKVLAAFGDDCDPEVVALAFMREVKAGDVERAAFLLSQGGGAHLVDLGQALAAPETVPPPLVLCRLLLAIYRHEAGQRVLLREASEVLRRLPADADLKRGAVFNTALEMHLRSSAHTEAEEMAARALPHYEAAGAPYLAFYIHLHRAVIFLMTGRPGRASAPLEAAGTALDATPFEVPQDARFLSLLRAVVAYEQGDPEPMARFAEESFQDFAHGEIWPTIAVQALAHGADALLQLRGLAPAMRYLDSWRVQAWRTRRFRLLIEQREVAVLQGGRRWSSARRQLEAMATRIGRVWMDSSGENLADLRASEDLLQAMLWLRQQAFETPRDPALPRRLEAFARNPRLSWRNQRCLKLWQAWVERRQGRVAQARRLLADTLSASAAHKCTAPILEERIFVLPLLEDNRMMQGPMQDAPLPRNLRRGAAQPFGSGPLSRQEWRVLLLLAESRSNKDIAREMAVSLPTVKFHLKNLYAKLGVGDRRAAVEVARTRQLVDT